MFFQILLDGELLGEIGYTTLARAAAVWKTSGRHGRVVKVSADNRVIQEHSVQEAEKAVEIYSSSLPLKFF